MEYFKSVERDDGKMDYFKLSERGYGKTFYETQKSLERIENFLSTNAHISMTTDETANKNDLKAFISKNEYLSIEYIARKFIEQEEQINYLKSKIDVVNWQEKSCRKIIDEKYINKDRIKEKIYKLEDEISVLKHSSLPIEIYDEKRKQIKLLYSLLESEG